MLDVVVTGGTVYDGAGGSGRRADIGVRGDRVAVIGDLAGEGDAGEVIDAAGMAVAPGFINPLSHSYFSILKDPRSLGELLQGVTTQAFGEGDSMGPFNGEMRVALGKRLSRLGLDVSWERLSEFLALLERRGTSQNVCSFVGATTVREHVIGSGQRPASERELEEMCRLVDEEMADGALGVGSALIYPPGTYASTEELVELCRVAAAHGGSYISHLRSEGDRLLEALAELLEISERAGLPAEVFHLKAIGRDNWPRFDSAIDLIERARASGAAITADAYPYVAGETNLQVCFPPYMHDGGYEALRRRLADPAGRAAAKSAMVTPDDSWENMYLGCGGPDGILVLHATGPYRHFAGKRLSEVAAELGTDPPEAVARLVESAPDVRGSIMCAFFMMSEDNVEKVMRLGWVSLGSDARSGAAEPPRSDEPTHPRAYGCFARFLGHYVRERGVCSLSEAVRRLSALPAANLGLSGRGRLAEGCFADVVVFDPDAIVDRATYEQPHRYATGVRAVLVNGSVVVRDGEFTGRLAGRHLRRNRVG